MSSTASLSKNGAIRPFTEKLNMFLATPQYVALIMVLTLCSNILGMELPVYTVFTALMVYICLFGRDLLPIMPIVIAGYISPSAANNPGRNSDSVFSGAGGVYIAVLGVCMALAVVIYVVRHIKTYLRKKYKLLPGMLLLWAAYMLSGIGIPGYWESFSRNLLFAFLQGASICLIYVLFSGGVDWSKATRDYFAWIGFFAGCALFCQILWIYISADIIVDGVIHRYRIVTGWGIHNNLGGMLAMMIPFAFCLATRFRRGWLGTVAGSVLLFGVILSCSRNAILTGSAVYFMGIVLMLYYARNRRANTIAALLSIGIAAMLVIIFNQQILRLFSDLLGMGFDPNSRDSIYSRGMQLFAEYPIFGGSFFSPSYEAWGWATTEAFTGFFPPRWHNTFVQLLASCGVVGLAAYLVHRFQTIRLILRNHSKQKNFIACSILALLVCSLFDCHFFNIGPTMFYAMALANAENIPAE